MRPSQVVGLFSYMYILQNSFDLYTLNNSFSWGVENKLSFKQWYDW